MTDETADPEPLGADTLDVIEDELARAEETLRQLADPDNDPEQVESWLSAAEPIV